MRSLDHGEDAGLDGFGQVGPSGNDFGQIRRRFGRLKSKDVSASDSWSIIPDLILVDGGRGQLNSVIKAMDEIGVTSVPVASLAKEREEVFIPKRAKPIIMPYSSPGLQLLQRIRDEAHRFALGYHHKVRRKQALASALDAVPGIGPQRKRSLLRHFGSVQAIKEASLEELAATSGMNLSLARKIKEYL